MSTVSEISPLSTFPLRRALTLLSLKISSLLLIDIRAPTSHAGGQIRGSLNLPAATLFYNRGVLYELAYKADVEWVVFVGMGDGGDGAEVRRCAREFQEHVRRTAGDKEMTIFVLDEGLEGWVRGGPEFWVHLDGFEQRVWRARGVLGEDGEVLAKPGVEGAKTTETEAAVVGDAPQPPAKEKVWSWESIMAIE